MKINIKGFTFVGFAAAIFAMNAMAAATATNTVTSKSYVDSKISSAGTISSTSTITAPNEKAVYDALYDTTANHDRYQGYSTSANQVSNGAGGWKALGTTLDPTDTVNYDANNAVTAGTIVAAIAANAEATTYTGDSTTITLDTNNQFSANTTGGVAESGTNLVTGGQVYDAIESATGGNTIPAQDSSVCTAEHPCALVDEAGALNWRTMAQSGYNGGVCGNLNDNCGDQ